METVEMYVTMWTYTLFKQCFKKKPYKFERYFLLIPEVAALRVYKNQKGEMCTTIDSGFCQTLLGVNSCETEVPVGKNQIKSLFKIVVNKIANAYEFYDACTLVVDEHLSW